MLVQIGQRSSHEDLVDLLAECHGRIRRFLELARVLAANPSATESEARSIAGQVRRYFSTAFLHHVADEDELLAPRLAGRTSKVDEVLARMHEDHVRHTDTIALLVGICSAIERDPTELAERADEMRHAVAAVARLIEPHLEIEERELFPVIRALPAEMQAAIRAGMRQRRDPQ